MNWLARIAQEMQDFHEIQHGKSVLHWRNCGAHHCQIIAAELPEVSAGKMTNGAISGSVAR